MMQAVLYRCTQREKASAAKHGIGSEGRVIDVAVVEEYWFQNS